MGFAARFERPRGDVAEWNSVDLGEYLLDFVPRKIGIEDRDVERFPEAVAEVF
jgi:hypothetical protein